MDPSEMKQYTSKDITIFRAKSVQRSQGDGEERITSFIHPSEDTKKNSEVFVDNKHSLLLHSSTRSILSSDESKTKLDYEYSLPDISNIAKTLSKVSLFTAPDSILLSSRAQDMEKKKKFLMKPTEAFNDVKTYSFSNKKKEPKFVPYEPYKGCVRPIICNSETSKLSGCKVMSIKEIPETLKKDSRVCKERSFSSTSSTSDNIDGYVISKKLKIMLSDFDKERTLWEKKNHELQVQNKNLEEQLLQIQKEHSVLQQQLSTQSQVNFELKKLLVASVGEDVQGRVQCLTEDKARMATMIRKYSEKVDRDYEEKEQMSIHCDILRSKFLASSLLIDDLARWKGLLLQRFEAAKEAMKLMLEERDVAHHNIMHFYRHTFQVREAFDPLQAEGSGIALVDSCDMVSLAVACSNMAENIRDRLLGNIGRAVGLTELKLPSETRTPGEKLALQILEDDFDACGSLIASSTALGRAPLKPRYHPNTNYEHITVNCCHNCNGDIKVV